MINRGPKKIILSGLFIIFFLISNMIIAREYSGPGRKYLSSELSVKNGLPQNTVYSITKDIDGFIWIGTDRGVSRFDGKNFRNFNIYNTPEIKNNSVTALLALNDGRVLIGTFGGGLLSYENGKFSPMDLGENNKTYNIWELLIDSRKNLWVVTTGDGLIRINKRGDQSCFLNDKNDGNITSVVQVPGGEILAATESGIFKISGDKASLIDLTDIKRNPNIMTIRIFDKDNLYVGTDNGLFVGKIYKNRFELISEYDTGNIIREIFRDRSNNIWLATDNGLERLENGKIIPFISRDLFFHYPLMTVFQDPEDNIWIGSSGSGLRILRKRNFFPVDFSSNIFSGRVNSICINSSTLIAGTEERGVLISEGKNQYYISEINGLTSNHVNSVFSGMDGNILAGTDKGLNIITIPIGSIGKPEIVTRLLGIKVLSIFKDSGNNILIGTMGKGLYLLEGNEVSNYKKYIGNISDSILCITEDNDKNIILGTNEGLKILTSENKGLSSFPNVNTITGPVYDIFIDHNNNLWLGTKNHGLITLMGNDLIFTGKINNKLLNPVFKIIGDKDNRIWLSTNIGVFMIKKDEVSNYHKGLTRILNPVLYSEGDGIPSSAFSGGSQPAGWKTPAGDIYLPSRQGITYFNPDKFYFNKVPPVIKIEKLTADKHSFSGDEKIILDPGVKDLSIYFSAISFSNNHKVFYKLILSGNKKKWQHSFTNNNSITYKNLPSGKYRFNVTAANCDGLWNYRGSSIYFRIKAPFYKTLWFYFFMILIIYILSPFIYRWIISRRNGAGDEKNKYKDSKLSKVDSHIHLQNLRKMVEKDKLYLDPNLKIRDISSRMGIPRKVLSQLINELLEKNFKNFINHYRVEEARKKLVDPDQKDFILLKIIYETGFNSKSVFNTVFKKHTGMTPSEYRKKYSPK